MNEFFFTALYDKDNEHLFKAQYAIEVFTRTMEDYKCKQCNKKPDLQEDQKAL